MLLTNQFIGFVFLVVVISVSFGQQLEESFEENPWRSDDGSSYLFERQYNPIQGRSKLILPPKGSSSSEMQYHGAETYSRPVIIVSGRGLKDQAQIRQIRGGAHNKIKYEEVEEDEEEADERPVIVETKKKKKKKVEQPISAYVPTAYVIGNQGAGQPVSRVKQESDKAEQDYGIMVVSPKQPNNYAIINGNYQGANEEVLDRNTIQLYQEPQLIEALGVDGQNQIKEVSVDDKDESLDAQKSKLTLLFLGYEKF